MFLRTIERGDVLFSIWNSAMDTATESISHTCSDSEWRAIEERSIEWSLIEKCVCVCVRCWVRVVDAIIVESCVWFTKAQRPPNTNWQLLLHIWKFNERRQFPAGDTIYIFSHRWEGTKFLPTAFYVCNSHNSLGEKRFLFVLSSSSSSPSPSLSVWKVLEVEFMRGSAHTQPASGQLTHRKWLVGLYKWHKTNASVRRTGTKWNTMWSLHGPWIFYSSISNFDIFNSEW